MNQAGTGLDRVALLEDSKVRFPTMVAVLVGIVSVVTGAGVFIYHESQWRTNIQRDIVETRNAVNDVKLIVERGTSDRFTYSQMKTWVTRFRELNDDAPIKIPTLPDRTPNP